MSAEEESATDGVPKQTTAHHVPEQAAADGLPEVERSGRLDALPGRDLPGGLRLAHAHSRQARLRGLAHLDSMPERYGLELPRCKSIHTIGMRFALDLIWLDRGGAVLRIDRDVAPRRMRNHLRARSVIETNAGCADRFVAALGRATSL